MHKRNPSRTETRGVCVVVSDQSRRFKVPTSVCLGVCVVPQILKFSILSSLDYRAVQHPNQTCLIVCIQNRARRQGSGSGSEQGVLDAEQGVGVTSSDHIEDDG